MGILEWFKNRPSQFDPDRVSEEFVSWAIDKAVSLTSPRLKLIDSYQERLAPAVKTTIHYLREITRALPPAILLSSARWSSDPNLRAFFVTASDIPLALGRSSNLHTFFDKYPELHEVHLILGMGYSEQRIFGMALQGDVVQRDVAQTVISFSDHHARICGHSDSEVRRLLGTQAFEYLVAQALTEIGEERSERKDLEANRTLIRARLRLFQQHGPGLGTVFGSAPVTSSERMGLEAKLLENERQLEAMGSPRSILDKELECLFEVLQQPEKYLRVEHKQLRLSAMNVVVDEETGGASSDISFSKVNLKGVSEVQRAFVLARFSRNELIVARIGLDAAEQYL